MQDITAFADEGVKEVARKTITKPTDAGWEMLQQAKQAIATFDQAHIDIHELAKFPPAVRTEYIVAVKDEIFGCANERLQGGICQRLKSKAIEDSLFPCKPTYAAQCGNERFAGWLPAIRGNYKVACPSSNLFLVTFGATRVHGISCHEMLFGKDYPCVVSQSAGIFLRYMGQTNARQRSHILKTLKNNQDLIDCPWYILQTRYFELADECGYSRSKAIQFPVLNQYGVLGAPTNYITTMFAEGLSPKYSVNQEKLKRGGQIKMAWTLFVCLLCANHEIGADRFLLQDYSDFAVGLDREPLTEEQREWLSAFLCANPSVRDMVLASCVSSVIKKCQ